MHEIIENSINSNNKILPSNMPSEDFIGTLNNINHMNCHNTNPKYGGNGKNGMVDLKELIAYGDDQKSRTKHYKYGLSFDVDNYQPITVRKKRIQIQRIIESLGLTQHPTENGYYKEIFRSQLHVNVKSEKCPSNFIQNTKENHPLDKTNDTIEPDLIRKIWSDENLLKSIKSEPKSLENNKRNFCTGLYYLLNGTDISPWHRFTNSDAIWMFHTGSTLNIYIITETGEYKLKKLGNKIVTRDSLTNYEVHIKANTWFACEVDDKNNYCLATVTMTPSYEEGEMEIARKEDLIKQYPQHIDVISKLFVPKTESDISILSLIDNDDANPKELLDDISSVERLPFSGERSAGYMHERDSGHSSSSHSSVRGSSGDYCNISNQDVESIRSASHHADEESLENLEQINSIHLLDNNYSKGNNSKDTMLTKTPTKITVGAASNKLCLKSEKKNDNEKNVEMPKYKDTLQNYVNGEVNQKTKLFEGKKETPKTKHKDTTLLGKAEQKIRNKHLNLNRSHNNSPIESNLQHDIIYVNKKD